MNVLRFASFLILLSLLNCSTPSKSPSLSPSLARLLTSVKANELPVDSLFSVRGKTELKEEDLKSQLLKMNGIPGSWINGIFTVQIPAADLEKLCEASWVQSLELSSKMSLKNK